MDLLDRPEIKSIETRQREDFGGRVAPLYEQILHERNKIGQHGPAYETLLSRIDAYSQQVCQYIYAVPVMQASGFQRHVFYIFPHDVVDEQDGLEITWQEVSPNRRYVIVNTVEGRFDRGNLSTVRAFNHVPAIRIRAQEGHNSISVGKFDKGVQPKGKPDGKFDEPVPITPLDRTVLTSCLVELRKIKSAYKQDRVATIAREDVHTTRYHE